MRIVLIQQQNLGGNKNSYWKDSIKQLVENRVNAKDNHQTELVFIWYCFYGMEWD